MFLLYFICNALLVLYFDFLNPPNFEFDLLIAPSNEIYKITVTLIYLDFSFNFCVLYFCMLIYSYFIIFDRPLCPHTVLTIGRRRSNTITEAIGTLESSP